MKISPNLSEGLNAQAHLTFSAHSLFRALSLWAKTYGWEGTHQWAGDAAAEEEKHTKGILKLLADYGEQLVTWPAAAACPCNARDLPDLYKQFLDAAEAEQAGWIGIAKMAEAEGATDIDDFADGYLQAGRTQIKKLHRFNNYFAQVGGNTAAWAVFDKQRRRR